MSHQPAEGIAHGQRLAQPNPAFKGDTGQPDPELRTAIASGTDQLGYLRAVTLLCTSRLLMPIVASGDDSMDGPDPERHAEMAAVTIASAAGERALIGFTGIDAMQAWDPAARPVEVGLDAEFSPSHLLLDVAGPEQFVLGPELVAELAQGHRLVEVEPGQFGWMFVAQD